MITGLIDRILAARDALLSDPAFQRRAAAFPLTRPIAKRRARTVFDLCAGFVYSQVLLACVELKLFETLKAGPRDLDSLARDLNLAPERARRLLDAAATLGLVMRRGEERYALGPHGAAMLANPGILRMIEHHSVLYADLADPVGLLRDEARETALGRYWAYARTPDRSTLEPGDVAAYTALMAGSQSLVAEEILDAFPMTGVQRLLDVGGGNGTFASAVATRHSHISLEIFDLPPVAAHARANLTQKGLMHRCTVHGGDFLKDELPAGADLISVVRILHDHGDASVKILLEKIWRALPSGGTLLIAEPLAGTSGAEAMGEAYFGFYLMAMGSGRPRTAAALKNMLQAAGFRHSRQLSTRVPLQTSLIVAQR